MNVSLHTLRMLHARCSFTCSNELFFDNISALVILVQMPTTDLWKRRSMRDELSRIGKLTIFNMRN